MKYTGTESNVTIPDKIDNKVVKTLGAESFTENETVVGVTIPAQVTNLQYGAFASCTNLKKVTFAQGSQLKKSKKKHLNTVKVRRNTYSRQCYTNREGSVLLLSVFEQVNAREEA